MNHPAEISALKDRMRVLEGKLADLPVPVPVDPASPYPDGLARDGSGAVLVPAGLASYEDRQRELAAQRARLAADELAASTEGLPPGQFRDPCGLVRDRSTGRQVEAVEREAAAVDKVREAQGVEHRDWLRTQGLRE